MIDDHETIDTLLDELLVAHKQVDTLLAMVLTLDKKFRPSQSALWPDVEKRYELLKRHRRF